MITPDLLARLPEFKRNPGALKLHAFLYENLNGTVAVVCSQSLLASELGVCPRTIQRWLRFLENEGVISTSKSHGIQCAYVLDAKRALELLESGGGTLTAMTLVPKHALEQNLAITNIKHANSS